MYAFALVSLASYSSAERLQSIVSILSRLLCPALLLYRSLELGMSLFSGSAIHTYNFRNLTFYITLLNKAGKNSSTLVMIIVSKVSKAESKIF